MELILSQHKYYKLFIFLNWLSSLSMAGLSKCNTDILILVVELNKGWIFFFLQTSNLL